MFKVNLIIVIALSSFVSMANEDIKLIKKFSKTLSGNLKKAVKKGGFENGLSFCHDNANGLKEKFQKEHKVIIGRTSVKYRNPKNKPEKWQEAILKEYASSSSMNKMKPKLVNGYTVAPIYMKGLCLNCHGTKVTKKLESKLKKLYPEDKARGYKVGDFRGLFYIKKK